MMEIQKVALYLGIDVQVKRYCSFFVLNKNLEQVDSGWLEGNNSIEICKRLTKLVIELEQMGEGAVAIGIDAPRTALIAPRVYYWRGREWTKKTSNERGFGRHCEVVIKALKMGNPQWTPLKDKIPPWMQRGFDLFEHLKSREHVYEVFPSASYYLLKNRDHSKVSFTFKNFQDGPKDMLDACIAAFTVHQFVNGKGAEVGGGDGMGTIILPTELPVPKTHPVLHWPENEEFNQNNG